MPQRRRARQPQDHRDLSSRESAHAAFDAIADELEAEYESLDYPDLFTVAAYDLDEPLLGNAVRAQSASASA